jgi:hypothetical protein
LSCAEIFATCAISSFEFIFFAFFVSSSQINSHAFFIPFFNSTAFTQLFMYLSHSFASAYVSRIAVVVPSHAIVFVLSAASFTSSAPRLSNLFSSSISFEIVAQSFVTCGLQKSFSSITFLHFGHIVIVTVSATVFIQFIIFSLASSENIICFDMIL